MEHWPSNVRISMTRYGNGVRPAHRTPAAGPRDPSAAARRIICSVQNLMNSNLTFGFRFRKSHETYLLACISILATDLSLLIFTFSLFLFINTIITLVCIL